ncbi:hypothetical protein [Clostridium akagii]|uniref:hypothetical protein n=1 Tax=Clostridium akagii TaxID=91623 RepID=UPI000AD31DBD|nr:hypothetical protein [Clostridium akagii]
MDIDKISIIKALDLIWEGHNVYCIFNEKIKMFNILNANPILIIFQNEIYKGEWYLIS